MAPKFVKRVAIPRLVALLSFLVTYWILTTFDVVNLLVIR
ncbi:hypothetical protein GCM10010149_88440 [Nonomuraea roseoviolacea subsp. roseoviolacea]